MSGWEHGAQFYINSQTSGNCKILPKLQMCFWYRILWQFLMQWNRYGYFRVYLALFIFYGSSHISFTLFFKCFCVPRSDFLLRNAPTIMKLFAALPWKLVGYFTKVFLTSSSLYWWVLHMTFMKYLQWTLTEK